jgi:hypothetical protein
MAILLEGFVLAVLSDKFLMGWQRGFVYSITKFPFFVFGIGILGVLFDRRVIGQDTGFHTGFYSFFIKDNAIPHVHEMALFVLEFMSSAFVL